MSQNIPTSWPNHKNLNILKSDPILIRVNDGCRISNLANLWDIAEGIRKFPHILISREYPYEGYLITIRVGDKSHPWAAVYDPSDEIFKGKATAAWERDEDKMEFRLLSRNRKMS